MRKIFSIFLGLFSLNFAVAEELVGMPNPLVKYAGYDEVAAKTGFPPLFAPASEGFEPEFFIVIADKIADLGYQKDDSNLKLRIRTARGKDDISGVWGASWQTREINGAKIELANYGERGDKRAARWRAGEFAFAAYGEGMSEDEFARILGENIIEISVKIYSNLI